MKEILILGLGPAGSAAGLTALSAGASITMLGREPPAGPRVGETIPPQANMLLSSLGIDNLAADGHLPSHGTVSIWADAEPVENDFIFSPYGHGWHLDRAAFDARLLKTASDRGANIFSGTRLLSARHVEHKWMIVADQGDRQVKFQADFVLDATGRSSWFARRQGVTRIPSDRLVGIVGFFDTTEESDARTFLEASEDGWWYAARLPGCRSVAAFMTDADILAGYPGGAKAMWQNRLQQVSLTTPFVNKNIDALRVIPANGARLSCVTGPGWAAIGDAAASWDPLSSQGIVTAIEGANRCVSALMTEPEELNEYLDWFETAWADYSRIHRVYYSQVRRWPDSVFWRRRSLRDDLW
ncbi:MAG: tryptophan 7-halogenase [Zavarzinella sp.]